MKNPAIFLLASILILLAFFIPVSAQTVFEPPAGIAPDSDSAFSTGRGIVSGYVFQDVGQTGMWSKGLPGVVAQVIVRDSTLTVIRTTSSRSSDGYFQFVSLPAGNYRVYVRVIDCRVEPVEPLVEGEDSIPWSVYVAPGKNTRVNFATDCRVPMTTATPTVTGTPPTATPTSTPTGTAVVQP